jgi:hypothetical protein
LLNFKTISGRSRLDRWLARRARSSITCTATVTGAYASHTGVVTWSKVSGPGRVTFSRTTCTLLAGSARHNLPNSKEVVLTLS